MNPSDFHDPRHTANTRMMLAGLLQELRRRTRNINEHYTDVRVALDKTNSLHSRRAGLCAARGEG
jgi:hypothetical protein